MKSLLICLCTCICVFPQEKLSKDIDFLIGKEGQVKSQISELNLLMKETEVSYKVVSVVFHLPVQMIAYLFIILNVFPELGIV